jgi:hypothetical protein
MTSISFDQHFSTALRAPKGRESNFRSVSTAPLSLFQRQLESRNMCGEK